VFQAGQTSDGDLIGGFLIGMQAATRRPEREKAPDGHGHARLRVKRPEYHTRGILMDQVFNLETIAQGHSHITESAAGQARIPSRIAIGGSLMRPHR
jgi:hypothetical protein